jgi:hypothetical protein
MTPQPTFNRILLKWRAGMGVSALLLTIWQVGSPAAAPSARFVSPLPAVAPRSSFTWMDNGTLLYQGLDAAGQPEFRRLDVRSGAVASIPKTSTALSILQASGARAWRATSDGNLIAAWAMFAPGPAVLARPDGTVLAPLLVQSNRVRDVCWHPGANRFLILFEGALNVYLGVFDPATKRLEHEFSLPGNPDRVMCSGASTALTLERATDTNLLSATEVDISASNASGSTSEFYNRRLTMGTAKGAWLLEPSPNGDRIAIAGFLPEKAHWSERIMEQFNIGTGRRRYRVEIWIADGNLRSAKRITVLHDLRMRSRLRWRPDGRTITFVRDGGVWEIPANIANNS